MVECSVIISPVVDPLTRGLILGECYREHKSIVIMCKPNAQTWDHDITPWWENEQEFEYFTKQDYSLKHILL